MDDDNVVQLRPVPNAAVEQEVSEDELVPSVSDPVTGTPIKPSKEHWRVIRRCDQLRRLQEMRAPQVILAQQARMVVSALSELVPLMQVDLRNAIDLIGLSGDPQ